MSIKAAHSSDNKGMTGKTRSHIISRLEKAARAAEHLVSILAELDENQVTATDALEAKAYAALIRGTMQFEKQSWEQSVRSYSVSRVIYTVLASSSKGDSVKDLLSETIDPSIRYAAYQLKTPRTIPIPTIARKAFPHSDATLVEQINKFDPTILKDGSADSKRGLMAAENAPKTLAWRSKEVRIEDAAIALAWGLVESTKDSLAQKLESAAGKEPKDIAGAYDDILTATQDAVDATKQAIDELRGEGVSQSDPRMQSLQITKTAVNYELISWRIGRNRVLTGEHDGAGGDLQASSKKASKKAADSSKKPKEDTPGRKIAKLKERVALYDATLQSLESIKELPGVAKDASLSSALDSTASYFLALK
jgi:signal recognition particle subunit SRP68